jgi:hypothetical protein
MLNCACIRERGALTSLPLSQLSKRKLMDSWAQQPGMHGALHPCHCSAVWLGLQASGGAPAAGGGSAPQLSEEGAAVLPLLSVAGAQVSGKPVDRTPYQLIEVPVRLTCQRWSRKPAKRHLRTASPCTMCC